MLKNFRLKLAWLLAPAGADVHDPDETPCPEDMMILVGAEMYTLYPDDAGRVVLDVTEYAEHAEHTGWITRINDNDVELFELTAAGRSQMEHRRANPLLKG